MAVKIIKPFSALLFVGMIALTPMMLIPARVYAKLVCDDSIHGTNTCDGNKSLVNMNVNETDSNSNLIPVIIGGTAAIIIVGSTIVWKLRRRK
jgi:ABC-type multidrug transport system permease subunit